MEEKVMKKNKLTLVSVLVCFLIFTLFSDRQNLWAESKSSTFEMTSDVLCGTGGKSQSTTFILKVSAGAQPSPIGKQTSTNFDALAGWVYTSQPSFMRGDATGDGIINIADVVFLVNYLFSGGDPPCPEEAGDATCDGIINIADVVYLVNYLFGGGPPPSCGGENSSPWLSPSKLETNLSKAEIGMSLSALSEGSLMRLTDEFEITVEGKLDQDVAGIQLEIGYDPQEVTLLDPKLTSRTERLSIFFGGEEGIQKIGIVDLTGKNVIPAGKGKTTEYRNEECCSGRQASSKPHCAHISKYRDKLGKSFRSLAGSFRFVSKLSQSLQPRN
jgi:hypothetical protein